MTYPQFPQEPDCDKRLELLEQTKDRLINKLQGQIANLERQVISLKAQVTTRKEVHRDDYLRAGFLIAALDVISRMNWLQLHRIGRMLAKNTLQHVYGVTDPLLHCSRHRRHHPNCPACVVLGQPAARQVPEMQYMAERWGEEFISDEAWELLGTLRRSMNRIEWVELVGRIAQYAKTGGPVIQPNVLQQVADEV